MDRGDPGAGGPTGSTPALRVLTLLIAVLLVAGVVTAVVKRPPDETTDRATKVATSKGGSTTTSTTVKPPSPAAQARLDALVVELEAFVERTRGLKFVRPVKATLLADKPFIDRLGIGKDTDKAQVDTSAKVLRALGLIDKGVDLGASQKDLLGGSVAGFYDRKAKELFVRGAEQTPYVREVLVHELTHALQDQHFDINRSDLAKTNDERAQSFTAVIEGDAVRVQDAYRSQLSLADRRRAADEENSLAGGVPSSVPPALIELLQYPYIVGPRFVQLILQKGGQAALDGAFTKPPTTSEQLISPPKYTAGEGKVQVPEPAAQGTVFDRGDFGEFGLLLVLERAMDSNTALAAGNGWGGDQYVAWDEGKRSCVRDHMVMDTPKDRSEALAALRRWAAKRSGVTIDTSPPGGPQGAFEFTSCG